MADYLIGFARQHQSQRIVYVSEASPQGYDLYDLLNSFATVRK